MLPDRPACAALILWREGLTATATAAADATEPPAPDYAQTNAWAAWPGRPSDADAIPPGISAPVAEKSRPVDVFFIHPTTYLSGSAPNARYHEPGPTDVMIERDVLRNQASTFNECCRVYAPHYRQAVISTFFHHDDERDGATL